MKNKYRELFEEVHLSESAVERIEEEAEKIRNTEYRKPHSYGGRRFLKAAALLGIVLALGGTVSYAVTVLVKENKESVKLEKEIQDKRADIKIRKETEDKKAVEAKKDSAFYDVKLSYIPKGYQQDKKDKFFYREKKGNGFFSVILYHLQTEYRTVRSADKVKEFETKLGKGYYGGRSGCYFAILAFKDKDYMVYIDGSNMSQDEVKKIAQESSLIEVETKKDIQASYIEHTKKRQKEIDKQIKEVTERIGKR